MALLLLVVQGADIVIPLTSYEIGELLSTIPLERDDWIVIVLVASTVFMVEEFRKLLRSTGIFRVRTNKRV